MDSIRADPRFHLALAWLAGFTLIDSSIVSLALPDIARDLDRTIGQLAWVSTGFLLALAATLLAAGRLNDRYGSRRVLAIGAAAFFVTTLASGLAPTFELLVAARIAQGMAGGVLYTVSLAVTVTAYPPERRASAIGIYFTSGAFGAVIGPVLGGWLTDLGGWRLVFFAQLPLPVLIAVGAVVVLPTTVGRRRSFDLAGIGTASAFIVAATFAMLQLAEPGGGALALIGSVIAVVTLTAFVLVERRRDEPAVQLEIFANARFVVATAAGAAAWFAIMSGTIYPALYLQLGRQVSATDSGLILLAAPIVALVTFPYMGRVVQRLGVDRSLLVGLGLTVGGAAAMLSWGATTPVSVLVATNLVSGAGIALTLVSSASDALAQFRPEEAGTGSALFNSLRQLGAAMGVAIPAVAFEMVAAGSRSSGAALDGSLAAFAARLAVLAIPLLLVVGRAAAARRRVATA